ncbi:MAG: amidohydrolase [Deltaproteobacteria bacterium]|nr:amidohydrolase [Deltaproteobacteria bacterium]
MQNLKITVIQTKLVWEDKKKNLTMFNEKIDKIDEKTNLIIIPEMFSTGFSMNAEKLAEEMEGPTISWLLQKSKQRNADIVGSLIIRENGRFFNRLVWAKPSGDLFTYDKKHLFRFAGEEKVFSAGDTNIIVELCGWKIRPFICYDLRFPLWTRNFNNQYDLAIFIANWPEKRAAHWNALLPARAIENQCFVAGVNIVGKDGKGITYSGDSCIIDPVGKFLFHKNSMEIIHTADLSRSVLWGYRKAFPAWMDADSNLGHGF